MTRPKTEKQILRDRGWRKSRLVYGIDSNDNIALALRGDNIYRWAEVPGNFYRVQEDLDDSIIDEMSDARFARYKKAKELIIAGKL